MPDRQKAPAYQWYPKDYEADEAVKLMTYEQEGIYRRLLDHQALHGSIPAEPTEIAMLVPKVTLRRFLSLWPRLSHKFTLMDGRLVNQKLERVKAAWDAYIAAKSYAGEKSVQTRRERFGTASPSNRTSNISRNRTTNTPGTNYRTDALTGVEPSSASASAFKKEHEDASARAGRLIEAYGEWFSKWRKGAKLRLLHNSIEFQEACALVELWPDDRLEKLARIVLTTDDPFIAGTDRGFKIFALKASWADDRLRQAESGVA